MEYLFVPYKLALELRELGFDEPCVAYYKANILKEKGWDYTESQSKVDYIFGVNNDAILAPLYQQSFRFFREEYKYSSYIKEATKDKYRFYIEKFYNSEILTYEEAELECIKKLIEIVKNK